MRTMYDNALPSLRFPSDSLYAVRQSDSTLNTALRFGLPLQHVSEGLYDVSTTPLTTAGTYRLALDSVPMAGINTIIGNRTLSVQANVRAQVWIEFLNSNNDSAITHITAGQNLHHLRLTYRDAFHNRTDSAVGTVELLTLPDNLWGASTATLAMVRTGTGVYALAAPLRLTTAGTYVVRPEGVSRDVVLATTADSLVVVPDTALTATFTGVLPQLNAGESQAAFTVQFYDRYGNAAHTVLDSVRYTNATSASVANAGAVALTPTGTGAFTAESVMFTVSGNYTLTTLPGFVAVGTSAFAVQALAAETVELSDVPDTLWTAQPLPPVLVRFRDQYGNLTNDSRALDFADDGAPASTGTITLQALGTGVYTTSGTMFWQSGTYAFSVNGISPSNMHGTQAFFVKPDTAFPLILTAVTPQSLTVGDSAVHNWTLTVTGDNFNTSSAVFGKNNGVLFPTTFVDETTLTVVIPHALRQLGAMMLEVRSTQPPDTSNMMPVFVFDPSLEYHATLETISTQQPILNAQEQTALTALQQSGQYVSVRAIKLEVRPVDILTTRELTFTVAPGVVATAELGYPQQVGENDYYVRGTVESDTTSRDFAVTMVDNRYIGTQFTIDGKEYVIQPLGNDGVHILGEVNPVVTNIEESCGSSIPDKPNYKNVSTLQSPPTECDKRTIRILLLVTAGADGAAGAVQADGTYANMAGTKMAADIQLRDANLALRRSLEWVYDNTKVVTLEYVTAFPIPWDYNSGAQKFSNELAFVNHMHAAYSATDYDNYEKIYANASVLRENPIINSLREQYAADVVAIIHRVDATYPPSNPKKATVTQLPGLDVNGLLANRNNAFILFGSTYFHHFGGEYLLLGHEMGHLLGCRHFGEATQANAGQGHGYVFSHPLQNVFSSITSGDGKTVTFPYYSSPDLNFPGTSFARYNRQNLTIRYLFVESCVD